MIDAEHLDLGSSRDVDAKAMRWNVILAPEFLMLQTTQYPVFEDFLERWRLVLDAAKSLGNPVVERLGKGSG